MARMDKPMSMKDIETNLERLNASFESLKDVENRMTVLEDAVRRTVGTLMPKLDEVLKAQLSEEKTEAAAATKDHVHSTSHHPGRGRMNVSSSHSDSSASPSNEDIRDVLLEAVERGNVETLARMLEAGADANRRSRCGDTALHLAATQGHLAATLILLDSGTSSNIPGRRLRTPLHCAAALGRLQIARRLLRAGALVDAKDVDGATPLALAIQMGHKDIVFLLLENGARVNEKHEQVQALVFEAASRGECARVKLAVERGFPADAFGEGGEPLLLHAAKADHWKVVKFLLEKGAKATECRDHDERVKSTVGDYHDEQDCNNCVLSLASRAGEVDVVRKLLFCGATFKEERLTRALREATGAVLTVFVDTVPDKVRGPPGKEALRHAAQKGHVDDVRALLRAGVDVNGKSASYSETALIAASRSGRVECVRALLDHEADVDATYKNESALEFASREGHVEVVRELLRRGTRNVGFALCYAKNAPVVWALVSGTPDGLQGATGYKALRSAAYNGRHEALVALLEAGVAVDAAPDYGSPALHSAARRGHIKCVNELLQRGVHVDAEDVDGNTSLFIASKENRVAVVRVLLETGANAAVGNKKGKTAMDVAKSDDVRQLLESSLDLHPMY